MPKEPQRLRQHTAEEVEGMTSAEFKDVRHAAAVAQRGLPEHLMNRAQEEIGGGVYSHSLEHIGDLTHRINEKGGVFGTEYVKPKVESQHGSLHHPYGYEREMGEQMEGNRRYRESQGREAATPTRVREIGLHYANTHAELPVYNKPSWDARGAAESLGRHQFGDTRMYLSSMKRDLDKGPEHWQHLTSQAESVRFLKDREEKGIL